MSRTNQILSVLLVGQLALGFVVFWPSAADDGGGILFDARQENEIVHVEISDEDGNKVVLSSIGDGWVLPEAGEFVADADKITPILESIKALRTNRLVTMTEGSHARLEVSDDKFKRRLQLTWDDGEYDTLYLGSSGGAGATHFRLAVDDEVYITADLTAWGTTAQASSYIDTQYFSVDLDTVTAVKLENSNGTFEFIKEDGAWLYLGLAEDEQFQESGLTALLTQMTSLRMTAPLGTEEKPSYGLANPQAVVTLHTDADQAQHQYVLRVGAKTGDNYVASSSESLYIVSVAPYIGNILIDKTHEEFLQASVDLEVDSSG